MQKNARSFGTHDGTFHADEVTACALLLKFGLIDKDKIVRSRDLPTLHKCEFVCDVGGIYDPQKKFFDHHQVEYQGDFSSAGMILLYLKDMKIITPEEYDFFNDALILGVDAHDNGRDPQIKGLCSYSHIISSYNPIVHDADPQAVLEAFFKAIDFSRAFLERLWNRYQYMQSCRQIVADAMSKNRECLMFDQNIPWLDIFFQLGGEQHPALFVIMPSDNHWKLRGIPPKYEQRMQVRLPLPREWAGLLDRELQQVSGIPGAVFCHKGRFISVWETKDDALKALDHALTKRTSNLERKA